MSVYVRLKVRLGPLVSIEVSGTNCKEIAEALKGYEDLNRQVDAMCSDLAGCVYPEGGEPAEKEVEEEGQNEI